MKKRIALVLVLLLTLSVFTGCKGGSGTSSSVSGTGESKASSTTESNTSSSSSTDDVSSTPTNAGVSDETLTVAMSTEPNAIIPDVVFTSNDVSAITALLYETLYYSDYLSLQPTEGSIVEKTESIDDTHFRLTLKQGIKFHNGEELTTEDVLYTFQEATKGGMAGEFVIYDVPNFKIEDDYNIVFAQTQPWAQAQERLSFEQFFIINKTELEAAGGAATTEQFLKTAGTGKYVFNEWVAGSHISVVRNDNYWNQDALPYYKEIKFVFINDQTARGMAALSGDVDIAMNASLANYTVYEADPNVNPVLLPDNKTSTIFLNSGKGGPLEDVRVREAVYWCIDKEALRQVAAAGFGDIQDTIVSTLGPMWDGVEPEIYAPDYDKAKQLLADAGYPDGLTLKLRSSSATPDITMIQEQLRLGGINLELEIAEFPVHFAALGEGDFDMYTSSQQFAYYTEPVRCTDGLVYDYSDVMGGCGYKNEEYSAIAARCYTAMDIDERKAAYADLQKHFRENYVSIALYSATGFALTGKDVAGLQLRGMGVVDLGTVYKGTA